MVDPSFDYKAALAGCAQGEPAALTRLYAQEAPCMLALANIMLNSQTAAQDAVHDAFVLIWKNAGSYDPSAGSARAWIHSIMRYRTTSLLRQRLSSAAAPTVAATLALHAGKTDGLISVLGRQPEHLRQPVLMAFYHGMSYSRIAAQLGRPIAKLRDNVRSCLRILRESDPA